MAEIRMDFVEAANLFVADGIFTAERQRQLKAVEFARASMALEGFRPTPVDIEHERQFIDGEIDLATYTQPPRARGR